jgi:hypothetical protein
MANIAAQREIMVDSLCASSLHLFEEEFRLVL